MPKACRTLGALILSCNQLLLCAMSWRMLRRCTIFAFLVAFSFMSLPYHQAYAQNSGTEDPTESYADPACIGPTDPWSVYVAPILAPFGIGESAPGGGGVCDPLLIAEKDFLCQVSLMKTCPSSVSPFASDYAWYSHNPNVNSNFAMCSTVSGALAFSFAGGLVGGVVGAAAAPLIMSIVMDASTWLLSKIITISNQGTPSNTIDFSFSLLNFYTCETSPSMTDGDVQFLCGFLPFMAYFDQYDKICIAFMGLCPPVQAGCKYRIVSPKAQTSPLQGENPCGATASASGCFMRASTGSMPPLTAGIVSCIQEIVYSIFRDDCASIFEQFKTMLTAAVSATLVLYFVLMGYRITLGGGESPYKEIFLAATKVSLVWYFSVGDGINSIAYPFILDASNQLSKLAFDGVLSLSTSGFCNEVTTADDLNSTWSTLWSSVDCRIYNYLGFGLYKSLPSVPALLMIIAMIIWVPIYGIFIAALMFVLFVFLILLLVYFVHTYILSLISLSVVVFVAPIFVPMALFKATESYYKQWLNLFITFALLPVVLFAFLGMYIMTMDTAIWGTMASSAGGSDPCAGVNTAGFSGTGVCDSLGCILCTFDLESTAPFPIIDWFFGATTVALTMGIGVVIAILKAILFCFLFYRFAQILPEFSAQLSGSFINTLMNNAFNAPAAMMGALSFASQSGGEAMVAGMSGGSDAAKASLRGALEGKAAEGDGDGGDSENFLSDAAGAIGGAGSGGITDVAGSLGGAAPSGGGQNTDGN